MSDTQPGNDASPDADVDVNVDTTGAGTGEATEAPTGDGQVADVTTPREDENQSTSGAPEGGTPADEATEDTTSDAPADEL